jgi:hypothetical protein
MAGGEVNAEHPVTVRGVTVAGLPPVGVQHVPLGAGLTALYGKNGVGKTRLLAEVERTLRAQHDQDPYLQLPWDDGRPAGEGWAFYSAGGIHIHAPVTRELLARPWDDQAHSALSHHVRRWLKADPWIIRREPWIAEDGSEHERPDEPSQLAELGLSEDHLYWYLEQGHWFLQPNLGWLYLCDPDPLGSSPLAPRWQQEAAAWVSWLNEPGAVEEPHLPKVGRLTWLSSEEIGFGEVVEGNIRWTFRGMTKMATGPAGENLWLMPLPEQLQLPSAPDWVAFPFLGLGDRLKWSITVVSDGLPTPQYRPAAKPKWDRLTDLTVDRLPHTFFRRERSPVVHFDDALFEVARLANEYLADLFENPPIVRCQRRTQHDWLKGLPPIVLDCESLPSAAMPMCTTCAPGVDAKRSTSSSKVSGGLSPSR